jgi:hypothetical protein
LGVSPNNALQEIEGRRNALTRSAPDLRPDHRGRGAARAVGSETDRHASPRKIAANRRNAGTARAAHPNGKGRSKHNALRHGLAMTCPRPARSIATSSVWRRKALAQIPTLSWHFAMIAAEAELELRRVRTVRLSWLASKKPPGSSPGDQDQERNGLATSLPNLLRLERYERRALSRRDRALRLL